MENILKKNANFAIFMAGQLNGIKTVVGAYVSSNKPVENN